MPNNAINNINESTVAKIGEIMGCGANALLREHADAIIERLQEEALDNEGATQITVPMKILILHNEEGEFEIKPSIDLKKTTKVTFERPPVKWNPNQPDFFAGNEPIEGKPEAGGTPEPPKDDKKKSNPAKDKKKSNDESSGDPGLCGKKHPKFDLRCRLPKGHEGECKPKPCAFMHEDGKRICMAEEGHEGMHSFVDRSELN